ncbi:MAG: type II toxin-antitoxin system prevent-host-death family antitoxin [Actinomycetota bacterium]
MRRIGIRELRAGVATAVRQAGAGERFTVTVDGRPAAQLGPLEGADNSVGIDDLVAAGLLVAPRRSGPARPTDPVPAWAGARLDRLLRELRG